jgi:hypothetical protein
MHQLVAHPSTPFASGPYGDPAREIPAALTNDFSGNYPGRHWNMPWESTIEQLKTQSKKIGANQ